MLRRLFRSALDRPRGADGGERARVSSEQALERFAAGDLAGAEDAARRALEDGVDPAIAQLALGRVALARGDADGARAALLRALELAPELDAARAELAALAQRTGRVDEAIDHYRTALARHGRSPQLLHALGGALAARGDVDEAAATLGRALELAPDYAEAREALSRALFDARRFAEAERAEREQLARDPEAVRIHLRLAHALLMQGKLEEGWVEYDWRLRVPGFHTGGLRALPRWDGSDPTGRTLLVACEQGLGDAMLFARFVPELVRRGARVRLRCRAELERLFRSSFSDRTVEITSREDDLPGADAYVHLLSLPRVLGLGERAIARSSGYLRPEAALARAWRERVAGLPRPRIGLVWAGNPERSGDHSRSLAPEALAALHAARPDAGWISLQAGLQAATPRPFALADFMDGVVDFADTAAIVAALDLVVAVDTSVAHAAGSLGTPLYLLAPHDVCWRWTMGETESPWYPGVRVFRAPRRGDWRPAIDAAGDALRAMPAATA